MMAMPCASASRVERIVTGLPSIRMLPPSAPWAPERIFIRVDLPAPFSPTSAWISPPATAKSTPSSTRTGPNDLLMPFIVTFMGLPAAQSPKITPEYSSTLA